LIVPILRNIYDLKNITMNRSIKIIVIVAFSISPSLTFCKKKLTELIVTTTNVTDITQTTASGGGIVVSDGGAEVTSRGVCWHTSFNPTIVNSKTIDGSGLGTFKSNITQLTPNTFYYYRAYATNSAGTAYGNQENFTTFSNKQTVAVTDADDNIYDTITIGTQTWMKENLKTTKYKNGTIIPLVTDELAWSNLTTPGYCWYINDANNKNTYGALYNWYAVNTGNLCPTGWHVPTDDEWTTLTTYLGGESAAVGKLKETGAIHWQISDYKATNETGFSALPGGCRDFDGTFYDMGYYGYWWSSTEFVIGGAWSRFMGYDDSGGYRHGNFEQDGFSVRCIKD
jgi:uncharacterized protein (TIGR02145 family)